jgi:hypothetical protein
MYDNNESIHFMYHFYFDNKREEKFIIKLEKLNYVQDKNNHLPDWVKLEYKQCTNCKLINKDYPYCPIALSLMNIIIKFQDIVSYQQVFVTVETKERIYKKWTTIHQGLSSLLGILMVTSGCPNMNMLRPMVRFHLPFASVEETIMRSVGSYLLAQYFRYKRGLNPDINLNGLLKAYEEIQVVNVGMAKRLSSISEKDANSNAIVLLDIFAKELPMTILARLKDVEYLYSNI